MGKNIDPYELIDRLNRKIELSEMERLNVSPMIMDAVFKSVYDLDNVVYCTKARKFLDFISECMSVNNKETILFEKMLRYVKLLLNNTQFYKYTKYGYDKKFNDIIYLIDKNAVRRIDRIIAEYIYLELNNSLDQSFLKVMDSTRYFDNIITDEKYEKLLKEIPTK